MKEIIDRFIRRHEPVSSRMILEDYGLLVSSATVRNDMNALEETGYIEKPYASSGRVPTKKGYRFFVDWLLDLSELAKKERLEVVEASEMRCLEVAEAMRQTAFLLGHITGHAGFVIPPRLEETRLDRVVLARMDPRLVLLVIVSDLGVVEHGLIPLEEDLSLEETEQVMATINENLRGMRLDEVGRLTLKEGPEGWYDRPVRAALHVLHRLLDERIQERLYFEGTLNLAEGLREVAPERAMDRFVHLIHGMQDEKGFVNAVRAVRNGKRGLVVSVGDGPHPGLENYSVVTCDWRPHSGTLGVIGPLWMDYGKALSAATYVANRLEALLVAPGARDPGREME